MVGLDVGLTLGLDGRVVEDVGLVELVKTAGLELELPVGRLTDGLWVEVDNTVTDGLEVPGGD